MQSVHGRSFGGVERQAEIQPVPLVNVQDLSGLFGYCRFEQARRAHALIMESLFEFAPGRFFLYLPLRNWTSISVPLTRISSQRR